MTELKKMSPDIRKSHFKNIVAMASQDGVIKEAERSMLAFVANKWGLSSTELNEITSNPDAVQLVIPDDDEARFQEIYDLVETVIIDEELKIKEKEFCKNMAAALGYPETTIDVIIKGILEGNQAMDSESRIQSTIKDKLKVI